MTAYRAATAAQVLRVRRFGDIPTPESEPIRTRRSHAVVRITHASVGVTDAMAIRGDYLLAPRPGFVAGYDFVGILEEVPDGVATLRSGLRVAGVLPDMGAHANRVSVPWSLLVPVPDALEDSLAATIPLDAVTADAALGALRPGAASVLIQGAGGAVGSWAAQLAQRGRMAVWGTASAHSREYAESTGARIVDYRDSTWIGQVVAETQGGVDGAIDHTGAARVRDAVRPDGRVVRIAFGGKPGKQRVATASGFVRAGLRRYARPSERVCSVPMLVRLRRRAYREALARLLTAVAAGELCAPTPQVFPAADYSAALRGAASTTPGHKVVLAFQA